MQFLGLFVLIIVLMTLASAIRILREYERGVVFRLGRLVGAKGPGLIILIPFIDRMVTVSLRTIAMDIPGQDVITKDNVSVKVNAVLYFRHYRSRGLFLRDIAVSADNIEKRSGWFRFRRDAK